MMAFVITRKWDQAHMTAYDLEAGLKSVISRPDETINDPFASKTSVRPLANKGTMFFRSLSSCTPQCRPFHALASHI